jgi:glycosyltransferase involved in cell wall biosynthesis
VIIPVGPGHAKHLNKALDSLVAQTFKGWEVIVIDDTHTTKLVIPDPKDLSTLRTEGSFEGVDLTPYPFIQKWLLNTGHGAGYARNIGIEKAKAPLLFFLDADDYLVPTALEEMVRAYTKGKKSYVFSDWWAANPGKELEHMNCPDYNQEAVREKIQHAVSVLVETEAVRSVGGFDESLPTYEDWDFFLKLAARGYCGVRVPKPLLVYRTETGTRRLKAQEPGSTVYQQIVDKWKGVEFMPCCGQSAKIERVAVDMLSFPPQASDVPDGKIRLRYVGQALGGVTYLGKYQVAAVPQQDFADVNPEDVSKLLQLGVFQEF